jgi:hypothetical protein
MLKRIKGLLVVPAMMLGFAGAAFASPFDKPPDTYAAALNEVFRRTGSDLRLELDLCSTAQQAACRFSSQRLAIIVEATEDRSGIGRIVIAADLLRDHPATLPHIPVIDALITLTATMVVFDPDLPDDRRDGLVASLAESVHSIGQGAGSGVAADYVIALEQKSTALLVITMRPKPKS